MLNIEDRPLFAKYFQQFYKTGIGAEIGVDRGVHARMILQSYKGTLLLIDPWEKQDNWNSDINERDYDYMYNLTLKNTKGFNKKIMRGTSKEMSKLVKDDSLDFVYIDAQHSYNGCMEDLNIWFPKVRKGGLFSGHDYIDAKRGDFIGESKIKFVEDFGVKQAVDEFANKLNYKVLKTNKINTWYFIK